MKNVVNQELKIQVELNTLITLDALLKKHGIVYWLDSGTLLKAYRDKHIHSDDLDIGCWYECLDAVLSLCAELKLMGYNICYQGNLSHVEDHIQIYLPDLTTLSFNHIDICLYRRFNHEAVIVNIHRPMNPLGRFLLKHHRSLQPKLIQDRIRSMRQKSIEPFKVYLKSKLAVICWRLYKIFASTLWYSVPKQNFESLENIEVYGMKFSAPNHIEDYLTYRYGPNWRTPSKKWRLTDGQTLRIKSLKDAPATDGKARQLISDSIVKPKTTAFKGTFVFTTQEINYIKAMSKK